ncbi:aldehyde dehydrogenase family protein [Georgenia sp. Z1491]|uniref:aldehyde dehydrogenase family protein n=1 Tax=Georgenia sp. Z1491 TaxID=3416707 RepID=UPI003CF2A29D
MATSDTYARTRRNSLTESLLGILGPMPKQSSGRPATDGEGRLLVDGELVESSSGERFENVNPATGEVVGQVADGSVADLERATEAARRIVDTHSWSADGPFRRHCLEQLADAMDRHIVTLREALVTELGSPVRLAAGVQVDPVPDKIRHIARLAESVTDTTEMPDDARGPVVQGRRIEREPLGVVGAITPWNIPLDIAMAKVAGALAAGNAVVLKPAPDTPWVPALVGRLAAEETDLPAGVLNIVNSSDHSLGARLTADPRVDAISFTGSTATGRKVMAAAAGEVKKVHLELGGKNPSIVLDDADLEQVVPLAAALGCFNTGQSCILPSRLLVPAARLSECVELAALGMESVTVGDPWDGGTFMGPLVSALHRDRVLAAVSEGLTEGGRAVVGGSEPGVGPGYFVRPTLVADAPEHGSLVQEEVFGPVVALQPYEDLDDAVRLANGTRYGLAAYVWSSDEQRAGAVASRIRAGMVGINGGLSTAADMPFGGVRHSGVGREWGTAGVEEFLELKSIAVTRFV